jgi:hypothetical protein
LGQIKRRKTFGVLYGSYEGTKEKVRLCPSCYEIGIISPLQNRILMPNEEKPRDYDLWKQCYRDGKLFPIYETKPESKISGFTETTDNPFNEGRKATGLGHKRCDKKKTPIEKLRERQKKEIEREKDPDIKLELKKGLKVTKHYSD